MEQLKRYRGSLLGLAAGDAVGTTLEFKSPGTFKPITDMIGGGPFHLKPGEWTDDTAMALCLAESLIECKGFNPFDQMQRYVRWMREGHLSSNGRCFDIGNTVRDALARFERVGEPYSGSTHPRSAGNGSIMRLAPVPLFYAKDMGKAIHYAQLSSKTTHGAETAVDACGYMASNLVSALQGLSKEEVLVPRYPTAHDLSLCEPIAEIATGSFKRKSPPEVKGTGYIVQSLEAALWAFWRSDNFKDGCLMAANLGDDADTTAAVYGQIAGAFYGEAGIPGTWLAKLAHRNLIERYADRLHELAQTLSAERK